MDMLRRSRPFAAWLAALTVLLGALLPAAAQVVAETRGQHWVQICSASGMAWVRLGADVAAGAEVPGEPAGDGERHCPWCQLGDSAGLPPLPSGFDGLLAAAAAELRSASDPAVAAPWPSSLSRAPPMA